MLFQSARGSIGRHAVSPRVSSHFPWRASGAFWRRHGPFPESALAILESRVGIELCALHVDSIVGVDVFYWPYLLVMFHYALPVSILLGTLHSPYSLPHSLCAGMYLLIGCVFSLSVMLRSPANMLSGLPASGLCVFSTVPLGFYVVSAG